MKPTLPLAGLFTFLTAATGLTQSPGYQWTKVASSAAFAPRDGAGALVFQDRMWLLGGWNPNHPGSFPLVTNSEVWSSQNGADWVLENAAAPWEGRHTAGYVVHDDRMWVVGGDANRGHYQNDVWSSADGINWEQATASAPWGPRVLHYTLEFGGKIWVMGGQTLPQFVGDTNETFYSDIWNSEDGVNWTKVSDHLPWGPRGQIGGGVVFNDRMWIIGGGTYQTLHHSRTAYNDVWSSADGITWEQVEDGAPWAKRQYHDIEVYDGLMWVLGGFDLTKELNDVWYSANGSDWTQLPGTPWFPRHASSVLVYDDSLWITGGNTSVSDVWRLDRIPAVPEPGTLALLGGAALAFWRRRPRNCD